MKKKITIALAGNPNSGKSTAFNAITGAKQHIANYPGVTVEKKIGWISYKGHEFEVVDLPGTYSLTAYSLEEIVSRDFLVNERPDVVIDIVDASNLDRNLYLAVQLRELGVPLVIALNMVDMAESRGIEVNPDTLSSLFGAPCIPTVARIKKGIPELLDKAIEVAREDQQWRPYVISYGRDIDESLKEIEDVIGKSEAFGKPYPPRWLALKCLEGDRQVMEMIKGEPDVLREIEAVCGKTAKHIRNTLEEDPEGIIADHRYGYIAGITKKAVKRKIEARLNLSDQIDKVLTHRVIGPLIMIIILYGIYGFTFWITEEPVQWLDIFFEWLKGMVATWVSEGKLYSLIVSGIIDGVGGVLGFIPLIMFMFFAVAIMEDSGYMARIAYMMDRVLSWFGLHGNSVLPLLISGGISGGCAVPGVMATRILRDPKERIATLLIVPFMNCGAKLPVFAMFIAAFFPKNEARMMFIFTLLSWSFALFSAKLIRSTILLGPKTPFVMELPPYRAPTVKGLIIHTWERTWQYMKRAGTIILGFSLFMWAIMTFPGLSEEETRRFEEQRERLIASFLSLPETKGILKDRKDVEELNSLFVRYRQALSKKDTEAMKILAGNPLYPAIKTLSSSYMDFRKKREDIQAGEQRVALDKTIAWRMGRILEYVTRPIGFESRINIALVGGFAAKEVIVSTLGTAYSLDEVDPSQGGALSERLRKDPFWSPLLAFTLVLFTMLYVPCSATLITIKRESSWAWAGFSVAFNLMVAYLVALIVYQGGTALGIGLGRG